MPKWIHDRALSLKKDMEKTYGPEKAEQVAFAVATQQAHRLGKSPKTFKSKVTGKKETFGTPEGKAVAKAKFDKPKSEYKKTASQAMDTILATNESTKNSENQLNPQKSPLPNLVNSAELTDKAVKGDKTWSDLKKLFTHTGEKPTFQREEKVSNPESESPSTPTIKVAGTEQFLVDALAQMVY